MADTLIAAPYFGEFGWQLMRWQAIVRERSYGYERTIVHCEKGYEYLYDDFAAAIVPHPAPIPAKRNMWMCISADAHYVVDVREDNADYIYPSKDVSLGLHPQSFVKYGAPAGVCDVILIHARATDNFCTSYRNWPVDKWRSVVGQFPGYSFLSVGSTSGAHYIPGTEDKRGIPLRELADTMRSSRLLLSPSSGPAHFASLCGLRHVVWSAERPEVIRGSNRDRYKTLWNPLHTPSYFIPDWQPSVADVIQEVKHAVSDSNDNV